MPGSTTLDFYDRVWTPADLEDLPDDRDWRWVEIVDGMLVVSPQPGRPHAWVVVVLTELLGPRLGRGLALSHDLALESGRTYRVLDLMIVRRSVFGENNAALARSDVMLAVEIESPSSVTTDRITKPAEYAALDIPHFWRVGRDPLRLHVHRMAGSGYELVHTGEAADVVRITDPFPAEIVMSTLAPA